MQLTSEEKRWLPWFGSTGKLAMRKACFLNRSRVSSLQQTFENIANTRVQILTTWADNEWSFLQDAALYLAAKPQHEYHAALQRLLKRSSDFSELFFVSPQGIILDSTYPAQKGKRSVSAAALEVGLQQSFLHGPYCDDVTLTIGASSSSDRKSVV